MSNQYRQSGFGAIMAIIIVVILAALAAAMTKMGVSQQLGSAQDIQSAKAWQAAKAGTEWGLYRALQQNTCAASATLDLSATTGFWVTVSCIAYAYKEGESAVGVPQEVQVYRINAVACNVASGCPDNTAATSQGYIERMRQVIATN